MDLGAALERCGDLFTRYGGHAGAAGFELAGRALGRVLRAVPGASPRPPRRATRASPLRIDLAAAGARASTTRSCASSAGLAPCGPGNPDPLVAVLGLTVTRVRAATGGHSQLTLRRDRDVLDGIAFGRPDLAEVVREGDRLDVVARLVSRHVRRLRDAPARDPRRRDVRRSHPGRRDPDARGAQRPVARRGRPHDAGRPRRPPRASDPYGIGPVRRLIAPILVGRRAARRRLRHAQPARTARSRSSGQTGRAATGGNGGADGPHADRRPRRTSSSSSPRSAFPGSIVYAKAGNIWIQTGKDVRQLTTAATDLDAVVVARRHSGSTSSGPSTAGRDAGRPRARPTHYLDDRAERDARSGRRQRAPRAAHQRQDQARAASTWFVLDPPAGALAGRQDDRAASRTRPNPTRATSILQFYDLADEEVDDARRRRDRAAGPPGPGLAAGRQVPAVRARTPRRAPRARRRSTATTRRPRRSSRMTGPGYLEPVVLARRAVHRRDQDRQRSAPTS